MVEGFRKDVFTMYEELEYAEYISSELLDQFYELEKNLEEVQEMVYGEEKLELEKLLERLKTIKKNNDII
tara:strand:- start:361 stop:570 length:210 start_codon:yes stop_codon:yes gene_type:complete